MSVFDKFKKLKAKLKKVHETQTSSLQSGKCHFQLQTNHKTQFKLLGR